MAVVIVQPGNPNGYGTEEDDTIHGNDEANWLEGIGGNDVLYGQGGDDLLRGGRGNDILYGGAGNDSLVGVGLSNSGEIDKLYGDAGDDYLVAVWTALLGSVYDGGIGRDTLEISSNSSQEEDYSKLTVTGFEILRLYSFGQFGFSFEQISQFEIIAQYQYRSTFRLTETGHLNLTGTRLEGDMIFQLAPGENRLDLPSGYLASAGYFLYEHVAGHTSEFIVRGESGNDVVNGSNISILHGRGGNDVLTAGQGLNGGDLFWSMLFGDDGNDTLTGGPGNDELSGDWGIDTLRGGAGEDSLVDRPYDPISGTVGGHIEGGEGFDTLVLIQTQIKTVRDQDGNIIWSDASPQPLFQLSGAPITLFIATYKGTNTGSDIAYGTITVSGVESIQPVTYGSPLFTSRGDGVDFRSLSNTQRDAVAALVMEGRGSAVYEALDGADTVVLPTANQMIAPGVFWDATKRFMAGAGDDNITGSANADIIDAGADSDTVRAGAGDDQIFDDVKVHVSRQGNFYDLIDGGEGFDTLAFTTTPSQIYDQAFNLIWEPGDEFIVAAPGSRVTVSFGASSGYRSITVENVEQINGVLLKGLPDPKPFKVSKLSEGKFELNAAGDAVGGGLIAIGRADGTNPLLRVDFSDVRYNVGFIEVKDALVYAAVGGVSSSLFDGSFTIDVSEGSGSIQQNSHGIFEMAGLEIDYKTIRVAATGLAFDVEIGKATTIADGLIPAMLRSTDEQIVFDSAGVHYVPPLALSTSNFHHFYGFADVAFSGIDLQFDAAQDAFLLRSKMGLTGFIKGAPILDMDLTGANYIKYTPAGHDMVGTMKMNPNAIAKFGDFSVSNIVLEFTETGWSGTATVGTPYFKIGKSIGGIEVTPTLGFLTSPVLQLDKIGIEVDNINYPIPKFPAIWLQKIGASIDHWAPSDNLATTFGGTFGISLGAQVEGGIATFSFLRGDVKGTISSEAFTGSAVLAMTPLKLEGYGFNHSLSLMKYEGGFNLDWSKGVLGLGGTLSILEGIITKQVALQVKSSGDLHYSGTTLLTIPDFIPYIGGNAYNDGSWVVNFTNDGNYGNDFVAFWKSLHLDLGPLSKDIVAGLKVSFDGTISWIGADTIPSTAAPLAGMRMALAADVASGSGFDVQEATDHILLGANWENASASAKLVITLPDGTMVEEADFAAHQIAIVAELSGSTSRMAIALAPQAGSWNVAVVSTDALGAVETTGLADTADASFSFAASPFVLEGAQVTIGYSAFDPDSQANISFWYDDDPAVADGLAIGSAIEQDGAGNLVWNTAGVKPGNYFVYAVIDDGVNAPIVTYSPVSIAVGNEVDLSAGLSASAASVTPGGYLRYTVSIANPSTAAGSGVVVQFTLPTQASFVSSSIAPASQVGGLLTFDLGAVAAGSVATIAIDVQAAGVAAGDALAADVYILSGNYDPDTTNDNAALAISVEAAPVEGSVVFGSGGDDALAAGIAGKIYAGLGGNDVYTVGHGGAVVDEDAGGGIDEVRTALTSYILPSHVENLTGTSTGSQILRGNDLANVVTAGPGGDLIYLQDGGNDHALSGFGNDAFIFGTTLTAEDSVDGGSGDDQLGIQGNYVLTLGAGNLVGIETLALLSGTDTRFGDPGTNLYDYDLTMVDANVAAGGLLYVNYNQLRAGEDLVFDGSAESDGAFFLLGGKGVDDLTGGAGGDAFFFGGDGRFSAADRIEGGAGSDQLGLRGNYTLDFEAGTLTSVETLALLSAQDTRFAAGGAGFAYDIGFVDANVAAGKLFTVNGAQLGASETATFDGSAESDGTFRLLGGKGADVLVAGAGNDLLYGGLGADRLTGGGGADTFLYRSAAESSGTGYDTLVGFDWRVDRIDLPGATPGYGGTATSGSLSTATFDADMAAAMDSYLAAGKVAFFTPNLGTLSGRTFMVVDANGQAGYQAGQDYVFEMANAVPIEQVTFFI